MMDEWRWLVMGTIYVALFVYMFRAMTLGHSNVSLVALMEAIQDWIGRRKSQ
jgi:hypothetical protein